MIISFNSWCNRIFPIQETCVLSKKNLEVVVSKLVQEYLGTEQENLERPIKVKSLWCIFLKNCLFNRELLIFFSVYLEYLQSIHIFINFFTFVKKNSLAFPPKISFQLIARHDSLIRTVKFLLLALLPALYLPHTHFLQYYIYLDIYIFVCT